MILCRSARNVDPRPDHEPSMYRVDDGSAIKHKRQDGAAALAIEMLKTIKEP